MTIENIITDYLNTHSPVRTSSLIAHLMESQPEQRGLSKKTLYRKIGQMKQAGLIIEVKESDYSTYGIQNIDGRAKYLIPSEMEEKRRHISSILNLLPLNDKEAILMVLEEIKRYEDDYALNPEQLDKLVSLLDNDPDIATVTLSIIYDYVMKKGVKPLDNEQFLEKLRDILVLFREMPTLECLFSIPQIFGLHDIPRSRNVYQSAIWLLAQYMDKAVINQLKKDFRDRDKFSHNWQYYDSGNTADVVEKNAPELFHFQIELRNEGKYEEANKLAEIRKRAQGFVKLPPDMRLLEPEEEPKEQKE